MEDEFSTKIEFLRDILPNISSEDILARLRSAPPSERSTDAIVSFFLAEEEKKKEKVELDTATDYNEAHTPTHTPHTTEQDTFIETDSQNHTIPHKPKYQINDDDDEGDEAEEGDQEVYESELSSDPVEYSALTGKIVKTADQIKQEEADFKLAQKLYEDELKLEESKQYQSPYQFPYQSPYHKPPPQTTTTTTTTKTTTTTTKQTTTTSSKSQLPTKRPATAGKIAMDEKKAKSAVAAQLQEVRKMRESQWIASGGKPVAEGEKPTQRGFNAGHYNQMKEIRNKQNKTWHDSKLQKKRVWTLGDMEAATKQALIEAGVMKASDSIEVKIGKEALHLTNNFRKLNKLPPLIWHDALCTIGAQHSKNMAEHKVPIGHDGFNDRIKQYPMPYRTAAENVAMSNGIGEIARTAVDGWISSPGHCKNLLSQSEYCGIGCYQGADGSWYSTQLFAG